MCALRAVLQARHLGVVVEACETAIVSGLDVGVVYSALHVLLVAAVACWPRFAGQVCPRRRCRVDIAVFAVDRVISATTSRRQRIVSACHVCTIACVLGAYVCARHNNDNNG